jgi:hypothetical protein
MSFQILILSLVFVFWSSIGGPFAPVLKAPDNTTNDAGIALSLQHLKAVEVPNKNDVWIPAYPSAQIFQTTPATEETLPSVRLLAPENISKVLKYYKPLLTDWKQMEMYGIHLFYREDETKAIFFKEPAVQIGSAENYIKLWSKSKSTITIGYDPSR